MTDGLQSCRHVLLYGPPGAGKLTVARSLGDRHGFRVLDNHLTVDPALRLFPFGSPEFGRLVEQLRVALLEAAALAGLDVVSTLVYASGIDDRHVATLVDASERNGATVTLVQLAPSAAALEARIGAPSRRGTQKVTDPALLRDLLERFDLRRAARADDLVVDNTTISAESVADLIADHVGPASARDPRPPGV
ncbi:MAG: hypothetical protein ABW328_08620 [Ilumatobacteraceae bacterium]